VSSVCRWMLAAQGGVTDPLMKMTATQSQLQTKEANLVKRVCDGDREAFYELVHPYERLIYATAISVVKNPADAEEVAQEAVLKAFSNLPGFRGEPKFRRITRGNPRHLACANHVQRSQNEGTESPFPPRRGDFARDARENASAFQGLRALHCGTRRYPKCGGTGRRWKAVPNARRIQQTAIQKASETSVNLRSDGWNFVGPKRIGDVLIIHVHP